MGIRKVGERIRFEDMIEGDIVEFVICEDEDRGKMWRCKRGLKYTVGYDRYGDLGPILYGGDTPEINTHQFVLKLVKSADEDIVMTPKDLKSGMLIELRNGRIGIVVDDKAYDDTWGCITQIDHYNDSFINTHDTYRASRDYDMVSVYSKGNLINKTSGLFSTDSRELLWKRKSESQERMEAIEQQMRELADELESIRNGEE